MSNHEVDLSSFEIGDYECGASLLVRSIWFFVGLPVLRCSVLPLSNVRRVLLRLFGAKIGQSVTIRPGVRVKNPWRLTVGDFSMIGEDVWIDNLEDVWLGDHVCVSQGAYLCTGNHDWASPSFRYRLAPIHVDRGAWIGARALISPGVRVSEHCVIAAGSVLTKDTESFGIYSGNPATRVNTRTFRPDAPEASTQRKAAVRW
jgi:putative colanic acid biosynthesis acetyltransferase WcaF